MIQKGNASLLHHFPKAYGMIRKGNASLYPPAFMPRGIKFLLFRSSVRMFVCSFVRLFVRTSFRRVEFTSKFCVKVSQVVYISATTHQKAFIFGP